MSKSILPRPRRTSRLHRGHRTRKKNQETCPSEKRFFSPVTWVVGLRASVLYVTYFLEKVWAKPPITISKPNTMSSFFISINLRRIQSLSNLPLIALFLLACPILPLFRSSIFIKNSPRKRPLCQSPPRITHVLINPSFPTPIMSNGSR